MDDEGRKVDENRAARQGEEGGLLTVSRATGPPGSIRGGVRDCHQCVVWAGQASCRVWGGALSQPDMRTLARTGF